MGPRTPDGVEHVEAARGQDGVLRLERPFPVTIELSAQSTPGHPLRWSAW
ncbi:hypothetical protein [Saccharothrix sp. Mg75]